MDRSLDPLLLDLVEWIARAPRTQADVMDAWRTNCPRLTVWEEAEERGFVRRGATRDAIVARTAEGRRFLEARRGPEALGIAAAALMSAPRTLPAADG